MWVFGWRVLGWLVLGRRRFVLGRGGDLRCGVVDVFDCHGRFALVRWRQFAITRTPYLASQRAALL